MNWWQSILIGIVEGLTEYLPVSSTGHILLTQKLLGIAPEPGPAREAANAYAVVVQIGAILAVQLWLYFNMIVLLIGFELNSSITKARLDRSESLRPKGVRP